MLDLNLFHTCLHESALGIYEELWWNLDKIPLCFLFSFSSWWQLGLSVLCHRLYMPEMSLGMTTPGKGQAITKHAPCLKLNLVKRLWFSFREWLGRSPLRGVGEQRYQADVVGPWKPFLGAVLLFDSGIISCVISTKNWHMCKQDRPVRIFLEEYPNWKLALC